MTSVVSSWCCAARCSSTRCAACCTPTGGRWSCRAPRPGSPRAVSRVRATAAAAQLPEGTRATSGPTAAESRTSTSAVARATANNTTPQNGDAFYYLGVVLQAQEKYAEAEDCLYQACWYPAWQQAASYALAEIAIATRRPVEAGALLQERSGDRARRLEKILTSDVFNDDYRLADPVQMRLENACVAIGAGSWQRALLQLGDDGSYPLLHYYRAYCLSRLGRTNEAQAACKLGAAAPADY